MTSPGLRCSLTLMLISNLLWHYFSAVSNISALIFWSRKMVTRPVATGVHSGVVPQTLFAHPKILLRPEKFALNIKEKQKPCSLKMNFLPQTNLTTGLMVTLYNRQTLLCAYSRTLLYRNSESRGTAHLLVYQRSINTGVKSTRSSADVVPCVGFSLCDCTTQASFVSQSSVHGHCRGYLSADCVQAWTGHCGRYFATSVTMSEHWWDGKAKA